jgi:hypothetical protein
MCKKTIIILKIDFEKAFDKVEYNAICNVPAFRYNKG